LLALGGAAVGAILAPILSLSIKLHNTQILGLDQQ
jgi:hypothetical protein